VIQHVVPGVDHTLYAHVILVLGQGVLGAFVAYLSYRSRQQDKDRELKFRQMELHLEHQTKTIMHTIHHATRNDKP
jgi:hypothetical protein